MTTSDPLQVMATICRRRHEAWTLLGELTTPVATAWAAGLPDLLARLPGAVSWLAEGWRPDGLILLEGLARRAARRGVEDLVELTEDATVAAQPGIGRLHRSVVAVHGLCTQELAAWTGGDEAGAKALRVEQMSLLLPDSAIRREASELRSARLPVWSSVAGVVSDYLLLETGR